MQLTSADAADIFNMLALHGKKETSRNVMQGLSMTLSVFGNRAYR